MSKGTLYLIPVPLADGDWRNTIPDGVVQKVHTITHFAVENLRTAVKHLHQFGHPVPEFKMKFLPMNKDTIPADYLDIIKWLESGNDVGVMPEAGCAGIADPGSDLVWMAHNRNLRVVPLTGPASPLLAVIAAGLNGQRFSFNGYLPFKPEERIQAIREFENRSIKFDQTQVFIEAPHRNNELLKALVDTLGDETRLSVASALTGDKEQVRGRAVVQWKKTTLPELSGEPAIFLFYRRTENALKQKRRNEESHRRNKNKK